MKEAREALTRLRICIDTGVGTTSEARELAHEANELGAIMTANRAGYPSKRRTVAHREQEADLTHNPNS